MARTLRVTVTDTVTQIFTIPAQHRSELGLSDTVPTLEQLNVDHVFNDLDGSGHLTDYQVSDREVEYEEI